VKKSEFMGAGCLVQGIGFLLFIPGFLLFIGTVMSSVVMKHEPSVTEDMKGMNLGFFVVSLLLAGAGASLILWGYRLAIKYSCGACGNRVEETARLCPTCHSPLN
jgi:hypothetical protein